MLLERIISSEYDVLDLEKNISTVWTIASLEFLDSIQGLSLVV